MGGRIWYNLRITWSSIVDVPRDNGVGRQGIIRMVENIEELCAQLQIQSFRQAGVLRDGEIHIAESGAKDRVPTQIAKGAEGWLHEGQWVEIAGVWIPMRQNGIHSGHDIGPLIEIKPAAGVRRIGDRNRTAALNSNDRVQLPARAKSPSRFPGRDIVVHRRGK